MIKINLQFFGGSGSRLGGSTVRTGTSGSPVSPTSTGGRLTNLGGGSYYAELDNGYSASVLKADNAFEGTVYEVTYNTPTSVGAGGESRVFGTLAAARGSVDEYFEKVKNRRE